MSKMIVFGDSFAWGSDMSDTMRLQEWNKQSEEQRKAKPFHETYSRSTWQAKLATKLGLDYECLAVQGCSNQTIVRTFFENEQLIEPGDLVSVNFTWRDRYDFYNDEEQKWHTVRPTGTEDLSYHKLYYKHLHSSTWDQIESLKAINLVLGYLKLHDIDFIATCIDDLIYNDQHHNTALIQTLQDVHRCNINWFESRGFYQWSKDYQYPISPMWHPLEKAHDAALDYILMNWTEMNHRVYGKFVP